MQKSRRYRILIVGCGQLGSRHLQAVVGLKEVGEIQEVDLQLQALLRRSSPHHANFMPITQAITAT